MNFPTFSNNPFASSTSSLSSVTNSSCSEFNVNTPFSEYSVQFDHVAENLDTESEQYILVVGGLGFIGSHTTLELLKEGYNVVVIDDLSNSWNSVLDRVSRLAREYHESQNSKTPIIKFHKTDYRSDAMRGILASYNQESLLGDRVFSKIQGVIHFAASKSVEESIYKPLHYYKNNVSGMIDFLEILREFGITNFVFSSSATVYGSLANKGVPLREEHCVHDVTKYVDNNGAEQTQEPGCYGLTSPYGRTKWMCEAILSDVAVSDPAWSITALRYFNPVGCHESGLLGEDPRQKATNLFPVITGVLTGKSNVLNIFGSDWETSDGTAVRDFIHVVDLAQGHIAAVRTGAQGKLQGFRTFNLGTGTGHTVSEVVNAIEGASGRKVPAQKVGRRPGDVGSCVAEVARANSELGWHTKKSLAECARDVWNALVISKHV